jgi:hypothetical protein
VSLKQWRKFFLYCTIINYAVMILWYVLLVLPHGWLFALSGKALGYDVGGFDRLNLLGLMVYKMAVFLFNLVPCIVLYVIRDKSDSAQL